MAVWDYCYLSLMHACILFKYHLFRWGQNSMTSLIPVPKPSYSQARETLVKAIPPKVICLLACGGRDCRYEGPVCWRASQQAIKGLFSSWMTDDIVAMARPSTNLIKTYNIIDQFKKLNIKSIINMQLPGEHAHCGPELEPDSGFTYSPQIFMENQIYFYNFGMADFGVSSLEAILDAVKVLAFSVKEGKVAVHCHAGLGRTGVLIACYLIYTLRISSSEAVHYVRIKRPCSIQTRAQINLVFDFERFLASQLAQYPMLNMPRGAPFSMRQYLQRQAALLHGEEAHSLAYTPKILHVICSLLTALAQGTSSPPDVWRELEKKAAVLVLQQAVRNVLVLQRFLPVMVDGEDSCESVSSWDEPFGFLERKREMLLNKRSYSESDLSKISQRKDMKFVHRSTLFGNGGKDYNGVMSHFRKEESANPAFSVFINESNCATDRQTHISSSGHHPGKSNAATRAKCMMKTAQGFPKFSSNIELCRNNKCGKASLASKMVAKSMALKEPAGGKILQRVTLLQEELNVSAYGWATLAMETDPKVLSALMWIWLEKLKDPVLSADDISKLTNTPGPNPLKMLHKSQRSTLCCLLNCVAQVTSQCPHLENSILQKLIKALTRYLGEETESHSTLLKVFGTKVREIQRLSRFHVATGMSAIEKNSLKVL